MRKLLLGIVFSCFAMLSSIDANATEATSITLKYQDIWGASKVACYQMTIDDDSTFTSGIGGVKAYWVENQSDNLADNPGVDDVTEGVFTFFSAGAATVLLWIIYD